MPSHEPLNFNNRVRFQKRALANKRTKLKNEKKTVLPLADKTAERLKKQLSSYFDNWTIDPPQRAMAGQK